MNDSAALAFDNEATWPVDLVRLLEEKLTDLKKYEKETRRIDRLAEKDVLLRIHRPVNRYQASYDDVTAACERCVAEANIVGFHCTRLHAEEIEEMLNHGMRLSSKELLVERIIKRGEAGDIPSHLLPRLLVEHQAANTNRSGMIWFVFSQGLLRDEGGVSRFFRCWGGESLYNSHEDDLETGPALCSLGVPCIVEAVMPVRNVKAYFLSLKLYGNFMKRRGMRTVDGADAEGHLVEPLPAGCIRRIIRFQELDFVQMTGCEGWNSPIYD